MTGIMKEWVNELGLRHQGVLVSVVRGVDNERKNDPSKALLRSYRDVILVSFNDHPSSFIDKVCLNDVKIRMETVLKDFDHYPVHFISHLILAAEIIGYKHPDIPTKRLWKWFYETFVHKLHLNPETEIQLDERLTCNEEEFSKRDKLGIEHFEEIKDNLYKDLL